MSDPASVKYVGIHLETDKSLVEAYLNAYLFREPGGYRVDEVEIGGTDEVCVTVSRKEEEVGRASNGWLIKGGYMTPDPEQVALDEADPDWIGWKTDEAVAARKAGDHHRADARHSWSVRPQPQAFFDADGRLIQ